LLDEGGPDAVTMLAVAERVGVQAPSLYKRVPGRAALLGLVGGAAFDELGAVLAPCAGDPDPRSALRGMVTAYRAWAHAHPRAYGLLFADLPAAARPPADHGARASAPLLGVIARLAGPHRALEGARVVTAFAHGFVAMELAGAFRLGGDPAEAFDAGVDLLAAALDRRP
jgi:AcrR family transcriptional regulator